MGFSRQEYWSGVPLPSLISSLISPKFYIPCSFPKKSTHKSVEQNTNPSNKSTPLWSINLGQKSQEYTVEKRQSRQ